MQWSYSALNAFETCPRRYYEVKVTKKFRESYVKETAHGLDVHKAVEERVKLKKPLPEKLSGYEFVGKLFDEAPGRKLIEVRLACTKEFNFTTWTSPTVWCRAIVDAAVERTERIISFDWKTGKYRPGSDQLKLSSLLMFAGYPRAEVINTNFVWFQANKLESETFKRSQIPELWQEFLPRVRRLELAFEKNDWKEKPSGLCRAHCPVTTCPHHGR